jgi:hypothetical protein
MAALGRYYGRGDQSGFRALASKPWVAHLLLVTTFAYVLFEGRFTIGVNTGGRGALQPFDFVVPLFGIFMFLDWGEFPARSYSISMREGFSGSRILR